GLIPLGYADGIPKGISGRSVVNIAGRSVPVIGKVCMDQFMVDLGPDASGIDVGDTAVLFGDPACGAASADDWGAAIGSHGDEIINRIAPRLPRAYASGADQDSAYECPDYQEPAAAGQGNVA
ncbi:alanine racemase, partial [Paenarthrobacter sp. CM16]|uniref:alanine racemase C-terminal domain-containing protein n=1 Tax=Paenarthrobacter sp. CM16 TaxID=2738447 RepID=UPI0027398277